MNEAPALTLADLERHDPHARGGGVEQRYRCPFPACAEHQRKRNLTANLETGAYQCKRPACGAKGKLQDYWAERPRPCPRPTPPKPAPPAPIVTPSSRNGDVARARHVGPVRRYPCRDARGAVVAVHCRQDLEHADGTPDKSMWWEQPDGTKGLPADLHTADLLYWAQPPAAIPAGAPLVGCEGEKAAAAVRAQGGYAVAFVGGASGTPAAAVLDALAPYRLILWPDNDDAGQALMCRVAAGLLARGAAVRWLTVPDLPVKGDAADYDGTPEALAALVAAAPGAYSVVTAVAVSAATADRDAALVTLRQQYAAEQSRAVRAEAYYNGILEALGNARMRAKVPLIAAAVKEYESALHRGALDAHGMFTAYIGTGDDDEGLADKAGVAVRTLRTQLRQLEQYQLDGRPIVDVDRRQVRGADGQVRTRLAFAIPFIADGGSAPELLHALAAYTPTAADGQPTRRPGSNEGHCAHCGGPLEQETQFFRRVQDIEKSRVRCRHCRQVTDETERVTKTATHERRAPRTIRLDLPDLPRTGGHNGRLEDVLVERDVAPAAIMAAGAAAVEWVSVAQAPASVAEADLPPATDPPAAIMAAQPPLPPGFDHYCPTCRPPRLTPLIPKVDRCTGCVRPWRPPDDADPARFPTAPPEVA